MTIDSPFFSLAGSSAVTTADACREFLQSRNIDFEAMLSAAYRRFLQPGATAIDVGAHAGYHYTRLKEVVGHTGRVIGFEPLPDFADHIMERHGGDAEIIKKALSTAPGLGTFLYMSNRPGESGFRERTYADERGAQQIEVTISTLDRELPDLATCDFVKIDTEGHELAVLGGGEALVKRTRPVIAIEYGKPTYSLYGHTIDSLWDWAKIHDYRISDLFGNLVVDQDQWHHVCDISYWDYLIVPAEKSEKWTALFAENPNTLIFAE